MRITRYFPAGEDGYMEQDKFGDYVEYEDYKELERETDKEIADLERQLEEKEEEIDNLNGEISELKDAANRTFI